MSTKSHKTSRRMRWISKFVALANRSYGTPSGLPVRTAVKAGMRITLTDILVSGYK